MNKISCEGIGTLSLGKDLERASGEAVVQISGGALPLEGTGASHITVPWLQECRHSKNRKTNGGAKTGAEQKKRGKK